ncbi:MAG: DUF1328 family protein [Pirellula staleyi]
MLKARLVWPLTHILGFVIIAGTAASIAKILFFVFLVLFVITLFSGRRGSTAT